MNQSQLPIHFILAACLGSLASEAQSATLHDGNLLISSGNTLYEVKPAGLQLQSFAIPYPGGTRPITEAARDIIMGGDGRIHVYNGTFDPVLSSFDPASETWEHRSISGWSTVNNGTYGGIGIMNDYVFLTDMRTFGSVEDELQGLIRYDLANQTFTRFATNIEPIDLTIGADGFLYALYPGGSPEGRFLDVFDPVSLAFVRTISFASIFGHTGHRSIAVAADSSIFVADWDGDLQKIDAGGNLLDSLALEGDWIGRPIHAELYDVDLSPDGAMLALGSRFGEAFVTDPDFVATSDFDLGDDGLFVAFVSVPEPSATLLFALGAVATLGYRRARRAENATPSRTP
jgi:hypothetical protein